jgi:GT2 family glycosyltransferase
VKLSVIIVNYNVQHFLEQCLHSVRKAAAKIPCEVYVVDNNSVDGSIQMVREKFPEVLLIENKKNVGFSKANNQAMRICKGEYVLLLNPDTVVEESTFEKVVAFMDANPEAGGLGVQMIDGKGDFLPESKRGLPTPTVAFYKIFGLSALFPKSKAFGRYHLGYLDRNATHEVEILSGAFMLMRHAALDKVGLLDEDYFMYGEDIDLSYRIILGGYKNYYFHDTRIIHYKGESTRKSSVNYVFVFYKAMIIFAKKHFSQKNAELFSFLINLAIYLRAGAAILNRFIKASALKVLDAGILLGGLYFIKYNYEAYIRFTEGGSYNAELVNVLFPVYTLLWVMAVYFSGGYDKPIRLQKIVRGVIAGTAAILVLYSLLPEAWRFSRGIILLGTGWTLASYLLSRMFFHVAKIGSMRLDSGLSKRMAIVGSPEECARVKAVLNQTFTNTGFIGYVSPSEDRKDEGYLGRLDQLEDIVNIYQIDEVIFCAQDLAAEVIIDRMAALGDNKRLSYKIAPPESLSIIGSNSIDTAGDLYVIDINSIGKPVNRRNKRVLDIGLALALLPVFPILMWTMHQPLGFVRNVFAVLFGTKSWVGYCGNVDHQSLPKIRKGVICPVDTLNQPQIAPEVAERLNMLYAKDYRSSNDLTLIRKGFRKLGQ